MRDECQSLAIIIASNDIFNYKFVNKLSKHNSLHEFVINEFYSPASPSLTLTYSRLFGQTFY